MSNLPTQPGQELNGFLAVLRDKDSIYANGSPFLDLSERDQLGRLITSFNAQGRTPAWERETYTFLATAQSKATSGLLMLNDEERSQLKSLLNGREPAVRTTTVARRTRKPLSWKFFAVGAAALVAIAITGGIIRAQAPPAYAPPIAAQPLPVSQPQPESKTELQQTLDTLGTWKTIAPSEQSPATANPAVLFLKADGGTLASTKWQVPFDASAWMQRPCPFIATMSVEGQIVRFDTTLQETFLVHVDQAFVFEKAPTQVYLVDAAGHTWYASLATAVSLHQPLTAN